MNQKDLLETLKSVRENSKKRNFTQSFELIVNLKDIDVKKEPVDFFLPLHFSKGKTPKICALIGPELEEEAKANCDHYILVDDFGKYTNKKELKRLATSYDFFIAQADIMPKVASTFGRVFGPKGKMPNPKAGCIVPPKANLKPLVAKLKKTVHINAKSAPLIQVSVGNEAMKDEEVADNVITVYNQVIHHLPNEKNNVKSVYLKLTMGPAFQLNEAGSIIKTVQKPVAQEQKKEKEEKEESKKEDSSEEKQSQEKGKNSETSSDDKGTESPEGKPEEKGLKEEKEEQSKGEEATKGKEEKRES